MFNRRFIASVRAFSALVPAVVCMLAVFLAGGAAAATEPYLEPRMTEPQYEEYLELLGISSEQRLIAEMNFDHYQRTLEDIDVRAAEAADRAGRRRIADALAGKIRVDADELRGLRAQVLEAYVDFWPELDEALDKLLGRTAALLTESQRERIPLGLQWVHREVYLHPHHPEQPSQDYAGDGLDLLLLIDQARLDDGELAAARPEKLDPILAEYRAALAPILLETSQSYRADRMAAAVARVRRDAAQMKAVQRRLLDRWQRLYTLNHSTAQRIADVAAETGGEEARARWLDRFTETSFTWLYRERKPDRQFNWLMRNSLSDEARTRVEQIHAGFDARRDELARKAADIMVKARVELGVPLHAMIDPTEISDSRARSLYEELLRNSGELATLDAQTSQKFEAALDERLRNLLKQTVR